MSSFSEEQVRNHLSKLAKNNQGKALKDFLQDRINKLDKITTMGELKGSTQDIAAATLGRRRAVHELQTIIKILDDFAKTDKSGNINNKPNYE